MTDARPPALGSRSLMRFGLAGLALEMLAIGVLASTRPEWFFRWFPFGHGWAGAIGAYNEHYVLDLGYVYLAVGIMIGWATIRLGRDLCRAALVGSVIANAPHLLFHLHHTHELPTGDNMAQDGLLAFSTLMGLAMLVLTWTRPESTELPTAYVLRRPADSAPTGKVDRATVGVGER